MTQQNQHRMPAPPCCAICGTQDQLLRCVKCKSVYYCSTGHQHIDWPSHKQDCRLLARQRNNSRMQQLQQAVAAANLNSTEQTFTNSVNFNNAGLMNSNVVQPGILSAVQPPSVIVSTTESEFMNGQAQSIMHRNNGFYGNLEANSTTADQLRLNSDGHLNDENKVLAQQNHLLQQQQFQPQEPQQQQMQQQQQPIIYQHLQQQNQLQQLPYPNNFNYNQHERSFAFQIGRACGDENAIGNANERRYEELCRNIINDMNQYGLSVVDDFLGNEKGLSVLNEVHRLYAAGEFRDGQLVNNTVGEQDSRTIRGDKIAWVKGVEPGCSNVGYLINQIDAVICNANSMLNNGELGKCNIKERTKAMVACYPGLGSHYVRHVDNPHKDGRIITAIYYLNVNWDTNRSGGILRIFPERGQTIADIEPKFDRLIFFWSDHRNPHEVQPAHRTRYAITVWYFDAIEREAALSRWKHDNDPRFNATNTTNTTTNANLSITSNTNNESNTNSNLHANINESTTTTTASDITTTASDITTTTTPTNLNISDNCT